MITLNRLIKKCANTFGVEVHRLNPYSSPAMQLATSLKTFGCDMVFDIGANIGQFASEIRSVGYCGDIVSFEPQSDAYSQLTKAASAHVNWIVAPRAAVGDHDGEISINISGNSVSSSVLPMLKAHSDAEIGSTYVGKENVPIVRLDKVFGRYLKGRRRPFVKIDTQGFEWQVLDGMTGIFPEVAGILCEMSLVPLYAGQHLWRDVIERLEGEGYTLWALQQGFTDLKDGRSLQVDGIFFRV